VPTGDQGVRAGEDAVVRRAVESLVRLASDPSPDVNDEGRGLIAQGLSLQAAGMDGPAIASYARAAELGVTDAALAFMLGTLCRRAGQPERAIVYFGAVVGNTAYALAAHRALGACYRQVGSPSRSLLHMVQATRCADVEAAAPARAALLEKMYTAYLLPDNGKTLLGEQQVLSGAVERLLEVRDLRAHVAELRRRLDAAGNRAVPTPVVELLELPDHEAVLKAMEASRGYLAQGLSRMAADECFGAISRAPGFLPAHLLLGEILLRENRADDAVAKLRAVAETYAARGRLVHAVAVLRSLVSVMPMDVDAHRRLSELLVQVGDLDQALEEHLTLADIFYRMAESDRAIETYIQALGLAGGVPTRAGWE